MTLFIAESALAVSRTDFFQGSLNYKSSKPIIHTVQENEIIDWQLKLAQWEGIYSEPTSAAAFAGTFKLIESKKIAKGSTVLVPVTGSGLKDLSPI